MCFSANALGIRLCGLSIPDEGEFPWEGGEGGDAGCRAGCGVKAVRSAAQIRGSGDAWPAELAKMPH